jgi:hypothetical protein
MEIITEPSGLVHNHESQSGVAWGAVLGGSFVAAAFYLILLALGAGFELSVVSLWSTDGTATKLETGVIVWLVFAEVIASALGGYLTGRWRIKWASIHADEVHFRDTANGFLSWAVALVLSVSFLLSTAASVLGPRQGLVRSTAESAPQASSSNSNAYFVDKLFRSERLETEKNDVIARAEAERILAKGVHQEQFPAADQDYLTRLTAAKSGTNQTEAARRVSDVIAEIRQHEETAQKVAGRLLVWTFLALMMGAFSASLAATIGGRHRDHLHTV